MQITSTFPRALPSEKLRFLLLIHISISSQNTLAQLSTKGRFAGDFSDLPAGS